MVAVSSLRFLASSSPSPSQPRRFLYAGGMGAIPTLRVAASAAPALPRARRLSYAGEMDASLRVAAQASPAVARTQRLSYAGEIGASLRIVAQASPAVARPQRLSCAGEIGASLRVVAQASPAVASPRRFPYAVFPFAGSGCTAAAPGFQAHCLPPRQAEGADDLRREELSQSPTTPGMPWWLRAICTFSSEKTKRPVVHLLGVLVLSGIKSTEFRGFVEWAAARFKLPEKLTAGILLGAAAIAVLFDVAVMGKDINEVCSYLLTHGPMVQDADLKKSACTSD